MTASPDYTESKRGSPVNLTLALPSALREVTIDGEIFLLVRRSALDALYTSSGTGDRAATQGPAPRAASDRRHENRATRTAPVKASSPAPKPKTSNPPPAPEAAEPVVSGALRDAVLSEIRRAPSQTSIDLFEVIRKTIPSTSSGSVYQCVKRLVRQGFVEGRPDEIGRMAWHPVRTARKAAGEATITPSGPSPSIPENGAPAGSRAPGAARPGAAV
jgi:hypothetical protein